MRRLSPGTVTLGVFAILFGLATAYAVRRYLDVPPEVAKPAPKAKTADLVVAAVNLPAYSRIQEKYLKVVQVPAEKLPKGAVTAKSLALYRVVKSTIMAEQPVMEESLYSVGELPTLAERLPPGHRAVTLSISGDAALNGMIQPESHVDITLTFKGDSPEAQGMATMTLMRKVLVLATSATRFPRSEDRPIKVQDITVAVTPEDANRLVLAQKYGTLSAALCGNQDDGTPLASADDRHLIDRNALLGLEPQPTPAPAVVVQKRVEVWRNGKRAEMVFGADEILESINATAVAEGREPMKALPVSAPQSEGGKKPCKDCEKKKALKEAAEAAEKAASQEALEAIQGAEDATRQAVPGRPISSPQPTPAPNHGASSGAGGAGAAVEVSVEAEQTGR